jgi:lincosamide nucleotidyltransferase A/C/D/E
VLTARSAAELCRVLSVAAIEYWVMGGWGVDALLGRVTREHKDLDILVTLDHLPVLWRVLDEHGFAEAHIWEESRPVPCGAGLSPSAFVAADAQGRMIDVHAISLAAEGGIVQHYDPPWPLPASIAANGVIGGESVPCVSIETQRAMHTGYALPDAHRDDVERLGLAGGHDAAV